MNDWNMEQLEYAIAEMDRIQAKFYMDSVGNEVENILNDTQEKLRDIYNMQNGIEE